ncbi:MAG TPA: hypothetical protein VK563_18070 [Puia sp.]|nr:hypothetical protein [Puia sp.]
MNILLIPFFVLVAEGTITAQRPSSMPSDGQQVKTKEINKIIQKSSPPIEEIADKFYNTYETGVEDLVFSFEKKAGKWRIDTRKWQAGNLVPTGTIFSMTSILAATNKMGLDIAGHSEQSAWQEIGL